MTTPSASFDRPALRTKARKLRKAAVQLQEDSDSALDELLEKVQEETSVNTIDSQPAPIYAGVIAALREGVIDARDKVSAVVKSMNDDADVLDQVAGEADRAEEASIQGLGTVAAEPPAAPGSSAPTGLSSAGPGSLPPSPAA